jgi:hypothetical protein
MYSKQSPKQISTNLQLFILEACSTSLYMTNTWQKEYGGNRKEVFFLLNLMVGNK